MAAKKTSTFMLVRWIGEESLSVIPAAENHNGDTPIVGRCGDYKWGGKYYEGEILALSESRQHLNSILRKLSIMEVTREELLEYGDHQPNMDKSMPDSTTPDCTPESSPCKKPKRARKQLKANPVVGKDKKKAKIKSYQERAQQLFKKPPYAPDDANCADSNGSSDLTIKQLQNELANLKKQLLDATKSAEATKNANGDSAASSTKQNTTNITEDATYNTGGYKSQIDDLKENHDPSAKTESARNVDHSNSRVAHGFDFKNNVQTPNSYIYEDRNESGYGYSPDWQFSNDKGDYVESTPRRFLSQNAKRISADFCKPRPELDTKVYTTESTLTSPKQIELVEGYGVYLTKRQLEEAVEQSQKSPTKMIRNLLAVFFTPSILSQSSCLGTRSYQGLNRDIIGACFKFVMSKFPEVKRTLLVNEVNDKCANYRRKSKQKNE